MAVEQAAFRAIEPVRLPPEVAEGLWADDVRGAARALTSLMSHSAELSNGDELTVRELRAAEQRVRDVLVLRCWQACGADGACSGHERRLAFETLLEEIVGVEYFENPQYRARIFLSFHKILGNTRETFCSMRRPRPPRKKRRARSIACSAGSLSFAE